MEIPDIKPRHPLVLHGTEPALDLGLLCWSIRLVIMNDRTDTGCKQFHLFVLVTFSVIKVKKLWSAVPGNSRFDNGHEIYEVIIKKDINADDEAACIINQCDDIYPVLFAIVRLKIRSDAGITTPDFVDMGSFVTAHIRVCGSLQLDCQLVHVAVNGGFRYFSAFDAAIVLKLSENG